MRTIDIAMMSPAFRFCAEHGLRLEKSLAAAKIPMRMPDLGGRITLMQMYRFYTSLARQGGADDLGLRMESFGERDGDLIRFGFFDCSHLKCAIIKINAMMQPVLEGENLGLNEYQSAMWFMYRIEGEWKDEDSWVTKQHAMAYLIALVRLAEGRGWSPEQLCVAGGVESIQSPETLIDLYQSDLARYHSEYMGVKIDPDCIYRPLPRPARHLRSQSIEGFECWEAHSFLDAVRSLVASHLEAGHLLAYGDIAQILGLSERTFQRKLSEQGHNYRTLINSVRYEMACKRLKDPRNTVEGIAYDLGYSCHNPFVRFFKAMAGVTPTQYRAGAS